MFLSNRHTSYSTIDMDLHGFQALDKNVDISFPIRILDVRPNLTKDLMEDDSEVIAGSSSLTHCKSVATNLAKCFNQSSKKTRSVMLYVQNWLILYISGSFLSPICLRQTSPCR